MKSRCAKILFAVAVVLGIGNLSRAADFAYRQSLALCPYNPEAKRGYVDFLQSRNRNADAALVEAMAR